MSLLYLVACTSACDQPPPSMTRSIFVRRSKGCVRKHARARSPANQTTLFYSIARICTLPPSPLPDLASNQNTNTPAFSASMAAVPSPSTRTRRSRLHQPHYSLRRCQHRCCQRRNDWQNDRRGVWRSPSHAPSSWRVGGGHPRCWEGSDDGVWRCVKGW
jgi:hypothetical protein